MLTDQRFGRLLSDIGFGRYGHVLCPFDRRVLGRGRIRPMALSLDADLRDLPFALLDEREQVAVDDVGVRGGEAVREARIVDLHDPLDQLR